jgi:hypothetical protein
LIIFIEDIKESKHNNKIEIMNIKPLRLDDNERVIINPVKH